MGQQKMSIAFLAPPAASTTTIGTMRPSDGEADGLRRMATQDRGFGCKKQVSMASSSRSARSGPTCHAISPPALHKHESSSSIEDGLRSASSPTITEGSSNDGTPDSMRTPRPSRPSYGEEQKFFIMYLRIIKDKSWPDIEDRFTQVFGQRSTQRSKGGLTSVYYRIRKGWGLEEVLKTGSETLASDKLAVHRRAGNFSTDFLANIGYLQREVRHCKQSVVYHALSRTGLTDANSSRSVGAVSVRSRQVTKARAGSPSLHCGCASDEYVVKE
ncbi:hypothetical protein LTR08_005128 [Meristemomyces frigidus]|nr:hypothetical protein LTR08_005128 [Meristemomyces frigidus]